MSQFIQAGESEQVSFKGPETPLESVARSVCGLLNQRGGTVLWGIDPRGRGAGIRNPEEKARRLNEFLMRNLVPRPLLSVSAEQLDGKRIVLVEIPPGPDKPYALERRIWVRLGKQDLQASEEQSARMVERSAREESRWERQVVPGFGITDCDEVELSEARRGIVSAGRFGLEVPGNDEDLLRRLYLAAGGQLTNAAMVLFAREPSAWDPNVNLRIVLYPSGKQGANLREWPLQGPAVRLLKQAVDIIQQQTGTSGAFRPGKLEREDRPAYALFALREGLVNAIVHRDYDLPGGQLRVEIFPEHLIIQNPGTLPQGWTEKDILTKEESRPTNPDIARVFYLRNLMERLGIGGRKLVEACRALNARPPVWQVEKGTVSLALFRAPLLAPLSQLAPRQELFLASTAPGHTFKADEYAAAAGVSVRQARRDLAELQEIGMLARTGKGPSTVYRRIGRIAGK